MPLHPPRREPRVLVVTVARGRLAWAAADPWEIRGSGTIPVTPRRTALALLRVGRREKPTALLVIGRAALPATERVARRLGVPVIRDRPPPLPVVAAADLYPELRLRAPTPAARVLTAIAVSAVLHSEPAPRRYVHLTDRPAAARARP